MKPYPWTAMIAGLSLAACTTAPPNSSATPPSSRPSLANPASVFCRDQGGTVEMRDRPGGQAGFCHLPDGRVVEEWAYFRANRPNPEPSSDDRGHNARNSLDWAGTYRGVLPCADCSGIETVVILRPDGTFTSKTRYLGKDRVATAAEGSVQWDPTGRSITLTGGEPARYNVDENRLTRLALDGSPITGALADRYILKKTMDGIQESYWKLVELRGQPVPALEKEPHLILKTEGNRVNGFGGCNSLTGSYTLDSARGRISFGQLASTRKFCTSGMDVERSFSEVLGQVDNYTIAGDSLSLNRARMAPLARFERVYLR